LLAGLPGWEWGPLPPGPASKDNRDQEILELRKSGLSLQQIADRYNISRQRVHQIVLGSSR
jgi:DNA-binding CsgD family transcriptional regulator